MDDMLALSDLRYTPEQLREQVDQQEQDFLNLLNRKRPGMRAFISRGNACRGRVVILVGSKGCWSHGMDCYGEESRARAEQFVARYNR